MKRIGIYGGSFSPPHEGHYKSALAFYDSCGLDELLVMPAGDPPHKKLDGGAAPSDRLEMARIVFAPERCGGRNVTVCPYEIEKEGKSFTYETIVHFSAPGVKLYLLMGSDMFLSFESWRHPGIIAKHATLVLQRREKETGADVFRAQAARLREKYRAHIRMPRFTPLEVSSSELREMLSSGKDPAGLLYEGCTSYIEERGLYGTDEAALEKIRARLPEFVSEKRIGHVLSVEKEAARMGKLYGLAGKELLDLRKAALLHDLTHERSFEEQMETAARCGLLLTGEDLASPPVLHQFTGACAAKALFGLDGEGCSAISCHTTGKPGMTKIEKILCLADYIEETRPYAECRALREAFYGHYTEENRDRLLDECLLLYLEGTVAHLREKGARIHPLTMRSMEYYKDLLGNYQILRSDVRTGQ